MPSERVIELSQDGGEALKALLWVEDLTVRRLQQRRALRINGGAITHRARAPDEQLTHHLLILTWRVKAHDAARRERVFQARAIKEQVEPSDLARRGQPQARERGLKHAHAPVVGVAHDHKPRRWLDRVTSAGSIFLGDHTPEALGDYCSGTNHVLPTDGAAHAWSGVGVAAFQKTISVQAATPGGIAAIGPDAIAIAEAEGLQAHANAVRLRLPEARA